MTRRADIVWLNISASKETITAALAQHRQFNYFPVCAGKIDAVIGILDVRDYLHACMQTAVPNLQQLLLKPLFIPETLTIVKTLALLKEHNTRAACVIDEYGGIEGFVTKNGLLSDILHENTNTGSSTGLEHLQQPDGSMLLSGQMTIEEVRALHIFDDIEENRSQDYRTLAGYLLTFTDAIPQENDTLDIGSTRCTIIHMNGQRIEKVAVKKKPL